MKTLLENWNRFINESKFTTEESHIQKLIEDLNEQLLDLIIAKKNTIPKKRTRSTHRT